MNEWLTHLGNGVDGLLVHAALVAVADHADVTLLTPRGAPRVLDDPVVLASLSAVTDSEDTVVELGAASSIEDTTGVELEGLLGSHDGNGDGDGVDGGHEGSLVEGGDELVAGDLGLGSAGLLARLVLGGVRVVLLNAEASVLDTPLESVVHQATAAAVVAVGARAINHLLLGNGEEVAGLDLPSTLDGAGGGEGPAGTALALVLDGGDSTLGAPVEGVSVADAGELSSVEGVGKGSLDVVETGVLGSELLVGEVTELVDGEGVGVALGVLGEDVVEVGLEGVVLGEEVGHLVLLGVLLDEASEEELILRISEGGGGASSDQNRKDNNSDLHL